MRSHHFPVTIYYEDTDCGGVVYYANYLRFFERARTEMIGAQGRSVKSWAEAGCLFAVYKAAITYRRPATLEDHCIVISKIAPNISDYRMCFDQELRRDGILLTKASIQIVCVSPELQARRFPPELLCLGGDASAVTDS